MSARKKEREIVGASHAKTNGKSVQVERMSACGLDESEISYCMGIDVVTLRAFYKDELDFGLARVTAQVGGAMIKSAMRGDTNAGQFILRSRARWVTPTKIEQDVSVTVEDKRKLMDDIIGMVATKRAPVTIEHQKVMEAAKPQGKPS